MVKKHITTVAARGIGTVGAVFAKRKAPTCSPASKLVSKALCLSQSGV